MLDKIHKAAQLLHNMGWRYVAFRTGFELKKRTGFFKKNFPTEPSFKTYYTLNEWKQKASSFFFSSKEELTLLKPVSDSLSLDFKKLLRFEHRFFSSLEFKLGQEYDWITNPDSGFRYNKDLHWIDINDYSETAGDIKFVWEPSRFSYLYTYIRYEQFAGVDCSRQIFADIERWIDNNKINCGPNFKCSQEISLRTLNWTFALYYYKNSPNLTEEVFSKIQHYIYWQVWHVYNNINFSRIAVRNNHAITESLLLYLAGLLYPDFPGAAKWKMDGKRWFEEEITYQVYEDGTFLQFSMNYHRVVIQLLTWAIRLADLNGERFTDVVYQRAKKSVEFLTACMDKESGWLPNYGANDGALFFKFNDNHYRDYRPQLEALSYALGLKWKLENFEDAGWYGLTPVDKGETITIKNGVSVFKKGGYYVVRQDDSLTFIRCGNHKDRPSQADNLHLDVWYKGRNMLHDAGSYKYNTDKDTLRYFMGTQSHNTVMLNGFDQMEKGPRFIWYHWSQSEDAEITETDESFIFNGTIKAFQHVNPDIRHTRKITISKKQPVWVVEDSIAGKPTDMEINQLWHTCYPEDIQFGVKSGEAVLKPVKRNGHYSVFYGKKEIAAELVFSSTNNTINTTITVNK